MAVVNFEENGQGFWDFDSLEAITSLEFVNQIKFDIEQYSADKDVFVQIDKLETYVNVVVVLYNKVLTFRYHFYNGTYYTGMIFRHELERINSAVEKMGVWND